MAEERRNIDDLTEVADLALAAYLLAKDVPLWAMDRHDWRRILFVFEGRPTELLASWAAGTAQVNAYRYAAGLRRAKRLLFRDEDSKR